jgi:hypothetical protein
LIHDRGDVAFDVLGGAVVVGALERDGASVVEGALVAGAVVDVVGSVPPLWAKTTAGTASKAVAPSAAPPVTHRRVVRCMPTPSVVHELLPQRDRPT